MARPSWRERRAARREQSNPLEPAAEQTAEPALEQAPEPSAPEPTAPEPVEPVAAEPAAAEPVAAEPEPAELVKPAPWSLGSTLRGMFSRKTIDDETWSDLEDALLSADFGPDITDAI